MKKIMLIYDDMWIPLTLAYLNDVGYIDIKTYHSFSEALRGIEESRSGFIPIFRRPDGHFWSSAVLLVG